MNQRQYLDKNVKPGFFRRVMNVAGETGNDISNAISKLPLPLKVAAGLTAGAVGIVTAPIELAVITTAGAAAGAAAIVGGIVYLVDHLIDDPVSEI